MYRELCVPVCDLMMKNTCCSSHAAFGHVNREVWKWKQGSRFATLLLIACWVSASNSLPFWWLWSHYTRSVLPVQSGVFNSGSGNLKHSQKPLKSQLAARPRAVGYECQHTDILNTPEKKLLVPGSLYAPVQWLVLIQRAAPVMSNSYLNIWMCLAASCVVWPGHFVPV